VVAAFPRVIYVEPIGDPASIVAVSTRNAVRLPISLVLAGGSAAFDALAAGAAASIGGGGVRAGNLDVRAARWWRTPPPPIVDRGVLARQITQLDRLLDLAAPMGQLDPQLTDLGAACAAYDADAATRVARQLVGRGPGLTPAGDDVLAGLLVALHRLVAGPQLRLPATGQLADLRAALAAVAVQAAGRTTSLSATLLRWAAGGVAAGAVIEVADALAGRGALEPATGRLLAVGHTSGRDTASGLLLGARTVCLTAESGRVAS